MYLARRAEGLIVLGALCHEVGVTEMLRDDGFLATDDPTRRELSDALSRWIHDRVTRHNMASDPLP